MERRKELDDLVLLDEISEETVHAALKARFLSESTMYTYSGPVLVAINPFKVLTSKNGKTIYDDSVIDTYRGRTYYEMPPSIFSVAEGAYSALLRNRCPSAVIVSGESGSGKTESARQVLAYIARISAARPVAQHQHRHTKGKGATAAAAAGAPPSEAAVATAQRIKDRLVASTLVTEAFGNAMTTRNDNSSRFGKLMTVSFKDSGVAAGGAVQVYLLEKGRVVQQGAGDRNFHVFYYLLAGASAELRRALRLGSAAPGAFAYLAREYRKIAGVNDAAQFKALTACCGMLGIAETRQQELWRTLACILHLGNVEFCSPADDDAAAAAVRDGASGAALEAVAALMGVSAAAVEAALVHRTLEVSGAETAALQSAAQARVARDSLAKAMYEGLFAVAVAEVNRAIQASAAAPAAAPAAAAGGAQGSAASATADGSIAASAASAASAAAEGTTTGGAACAMAESSCVAAAPPLEERRLLLHVLDLYGFEVLEANGFAQLCINFVNERLQQLFIDATLRSEQDEYAAQGIAWVPVPYFDNDDVVQLLDAKGGVFSVLDDACAMADASGDHVHAGLVRAHAAHPHFRAPRIHDGTFVVLHYAGEVTYQAEAMGAANRDTLTLDVGRLLAAAAGLPALQAACGGAARRSEADKKKRPPTASLQFRRSVQALVEVLGACQPQYVRCVKPNDGKRPLQVDDERLLHQIRYLGLVEATRVKRAGFAYRAPYDEFLARYRMLSKVTWPPGAGGGDAETSVRALLAAVHVWPKPKTAAALGVGVASAAAAKGRGATIKRQNGGAGGAGQATAFTAAALLGLQPTGSSAAAPAASASCGARVGGCSGGAAAAAGAAAWASSSSALPGDVAAAGSRVLREGADLQFGASKLFLKQPAALFDLEYMRVLALGRVVSRLAALWRAHAGVRAYARIRRAWRAQAARVRGHLLRRRFLALRAAAVRVQAAARGFLGRTSPAATAMRAALGKLSFHGKTRRRMSLQWDAPAHSDWLGLLFPPVVVAAGASAAAAVAAAAVVPAPAGARVIASLSRLRPPQAAASIRYADTVLKVKQDYRVLRRALVVTSHFVVNLAEPWQRGKVNRAIPVAALSGVSLSPFRDGYLVLHVQRQHDFVCVAETKVTLARAVCDAFRALTGRELRVEVAAALDYRAYARDGPERLRRITVQQVGDPSAFEHRPPQPWEASLFAHPPLPPSGAAGAAGGAAPAGGRAAIACGDGVTYVPLPAATGSAAAAADAPAAAADAPAAAGGACGGVQAAFLRAERHRAFHCVAGDGSGLLVSVPVPAPVRLGAMLTDAEKTKMRAGGVRVGA